MTDHPERRPSFAERAERAAESFRLREEGCGWEEVADRLGCSVRTAERAYADHLRSAAPEAFTDIDVEALSLRVVRSHVRALDRLEELAGRSTNENASVGAARSLASVGASLLGVLGRVGLLPESGDRWRLSREAEQIANELAAACRRHGVPAEVVDEVCGIAIAAAERLNPAVNGTAERVA